MPLYVVHSSPPGREAAHVIELLQALGYAVASVSSLREIIRPSRDSVIILPEFGDGGTSLDQAVAFLDSHPGRGFLVYISDAMAGEAYKRLAKTGRGEWIDWKALDAELPGLVRRFDRGEPESAPGAKVVAFLPSKGGAGATTIARETGVLLAGDKKFARSVAIVDLNFQGGTLADSLDLEARLDIAELVDKPERLDEHLISVFASRHHSGLDIFSCPRRMIDYGHVNSDVPFSLLDGLSRRYELLLVDLPHNWLPWIDNVLQGSDAVVVIGEGNVPGLRSLANWVQHIEAMPDAQDRLGIVINQMHADLFGRYGNRAYIEKAFAGRKLFFTPHDGALAAEAANTGRPIVELSPRRAITKSLRKISDWIRALNAQQPAASVSKGAL